MKFWAVLMYNGKVSKEKKRWCFHGIYGIVPGMAAQGVQ
jgi:hypothetical protein